MKIYLLITLIVITSLLCASITYGEFELYHWILSLFSGSQRSSSDLERLLTLIILLPNFLTFIASVSVGFFYFQKGKVKKFLLFFLYFPLTKIIFYLFIFILAETTKYFLPQGIIYFTLLYGHFTLVIPLVYQLIRQQSNI